MGQELEQLVLPAGTRVYIKGMPFDLVADAQVHGKARNLAVALEPAPPAGEVLPRDFQRATLRGVLPPRPLSGEMGFSFDRADGAVVRLVLDAESVRRLRATLEPGAFAVPPRETWEFSDRPVSELLAELSVADAAPATTR